MSSREAFSAAVQAGDTTLACLLMGREVDAGLDVSPYLGQLDSLAGSVRIASRAPADVGSALQRALGVEAGYGGSADDYDDLRSSLLHEVLRRKRGLPILLSVVWTSVADRLGVPARCVGLPGHVMVCLGDPAGEHVVVDPFSGGAVRPAEAAPLMSPDDVLLRVLANVRALTARQGPSLESARTRLWAVELSLLLPRHPLELRRERGELLVRLGQHRLGASELEEYAAAVPDSEAADKARRAARLALSRLN